MARQQRLNRELMKMQTSPPQGISVAAKDSDLNVLEATIIGPPDSPYKDGTFNVDILIPPNYPCHPPSLKFFTRIYHPNIDDNGRICLDLLKMPPVGSWKPTISLEGLLIAVRMLMETPNPDDPLMVEIAEEYSKNYDVFQKKAEEFTKLHAV